MTCQSVLAKDVRFVQVSDVHLVTGTKNQTNLQRAVQQINKIPNIDFVMFTGDNIDHSNPEDLKTFFKEADKLNVKYYVLIGNHDCAKNGGLPKAEFIKIARKHTKSFTKKNSNYVFEDNGVVFVVVDGAKEFIPGANGYFRENTLKWFDETLTKYADKDVVVFQHFPVIEPRYSKSHRIFNLDDYTKVLDKHNNVIALVSGHYHTNGEFLDKGVYHISTPTLMLDGQPFKLVELQEIKSKNGVKTPHNYRIFTQLQYVEDVK